MGYAIRYSSNQELYHHGVLGMHWGERRYQNEDGSLTPLGREHYGYGPERRKGETDAKVAVRRVKTDEEKAAAREKRNKIIKRAAVGVAVAGATAALGYGLYSGAAGKLMTAGGNAVLGVLRKTGLGATPIGAAVRKASVAFAKAGIDVTKFGLGTFKPLVDNAIGAVAGGVTTAYNVVGDTLYKGYETAAAIRGTINDAIGKTIDNAKEVVGDYANHVEEKINTWVQTSLIPTAKQLSKDSGNLVNEWGSVAKQAFDNAGEAISKGVETIGRPVKTFGNNALTFITTKSGEVVAAIVDTKNNAIVAYNNMAIKYAFDPEFRKQVNRGMSTAATATTVALAYPSYMLGQKLGTNLRESIDKKKAQTLANQ